MGSSDHQATVGASTKKTALMVMTVVVTWISSLAPMSRNRSSWLTSSLRAARRSPVLRLSNQRWSSCWVVR